MSAPLVLLYSNRSSELNEYQKLLESAQLNLNLLVCETADEVNDKIDQAEIIFGVHLPADSYRRAKNLRWIQSMWAGVEGLFSAPIASEVLITKPWGVFGKFLSQYVFGNLLAQKIKLEQAREYQLKQEWHPYRIELLQGKLICVAGLGDVAADIAIAARAFGMTVWGMNSDGRNNSLADKMFASSEIDEFVAAADVLVLTLPATPATRGMFNRAVLSKMQKHAWLINVGRGALVEDAALIETLEQKRIAGAVLDVFNEEPLPPSHPYWTLENCVLTPHVAGPSVPEDICACFVENFKRYEKGEELMGLVDRSKGY